MTASSPGFIAARFLSATGLLTPSHTAVFSRSRSSQLYVDGSVLRSQWFGMPASLGNPWAIDRRAALSERHLGRRLAGSEREPHGRIERRPERAVALVTERNLRLILSLREHLSVALEDAKLERSPVVQCQAVRA